MFFVELSPTAVLPDKSGDRVSKVGNRKFTLHDDAKNACCATGVIKLAGLIAKLLVHGQKRYKNQLPLRIVGRGAK